MRSLKFMKWKMKVFPIQVAIKDPLFKMEI